MNSWVVDDYKVYLPTLDKPTKKSGKFTITDGYHNLKYKFSKAK